ncbi:MAG: ribokinase, partial [Verrucomicrobia bacterium]
FGQRARKGLEREGIDTTHLHERRAAPSGVALIFVADSGENAIGVAPGANGRLRPADIRRASRLIREADIVLVQLEIPLETVAEAVRVARKAGVPVILNPAPARALPDELLRGVRVLTPNESEAALLTGRPVSSVADAEAAGAALLERGVDAAVITLGARGALVATPDRIRRVPGFRVRPVDTTAAGDVFNGALAVALAEERPLEAAVRWANAAAALSVTRLGAQPSAPKRREIDRLAGGQRGVGRSGSRRN